MANLAGVSLADDDVFGEDDGARQLGTVTGDVEDGFVVALDVPVSPSNPSEAVGGAPGGGPGGGGAPGGPPPGAGPS